MQKIKIFFSMLVLILVVGAGCNNVAKNNTEVKTEEKLKIGFIGPLTGEGASLGENIKAGAEVALSEADNVEIIFADGKCNGKDALSAAQKLINVDKVDVLMPICSGEVLSVAPIAEERKMISLAPAATSPDITNAGDYTFRLMPSDNFQGQFIAEYAINELGYKKVAILFEQMEATTGVKGVFKNNFKDLGGEVLVEESFLTNDKDLRTQLSKIKEVKPDFIYIATFPDGGTVALRQIQEIGINIPILGIDTWDDPKMAENLGNIQTENMFTVPANKELPQYFIDKMKDKTGSVEITAYTPRAYDAVKILSSVAKKVGNDSDKIKQALYDLNNYHGISDTYTMDENGDVSAANYVLKKFENGKIIEL